MLSRQSCGRLDIIELAGIMNPEYIAGCNVDMSIVVGLIGNDGIVLATDSQRTEYNYHTRTKKLWALTPNIGLMPFGYNGEYRDFLVRLWREKFTSTNKRVGYYEALNELASDINARLSHAFNPLQLAGLMKTGLDFVIAGYDGDNEAKIMSIRIDRVPPWQPCVCPSCFIDGVKEVGLYWVKKVGVDDKIANNQLSCDFLKRFAVMVVLETTIFSDMICEPIQMAVVDKQGYHDVSSEEVDKIKASLDSKQQWLYDYFDKRI